MSPRSIKFFDYYAGVPLCFLLTILSRIRAIVVSPWLSKEKKTPRKIMFVKLIEQGATVLAYNALKRVAELTGRKNVFFCVFKSNRPILDLMDVVPSENVFEIRDNNLIVFIWDLFRLFVKTRTSGIDTVIDMEFFARGSAIITYLTGAKNRVGHHSFTTQSPYRGDLMTHKVLYNPYLHTSVTYELLVESLLMPAETIPLPKTRVKAAPCDIPKFRPSEKVMRKIQTVLQKEDLKRPRIIINPNAGDMLPLRKWDIKNFVSLIKKVVERYPEATIILTGMATECAAAEAIRHALGHDNIINLAGKTTLEELVALYTLSDLLITNDSGPGHYAALTNIKSIVLFGPETPKLFSPLGSNTCIIYAGFACSPCINAFNYRFSPCKNNLCMQAIRVDEVFDAVTKILG